MKKSAAVHVPLVSTLAVAALAAGCGSQQPGWQACVDRVQGTAVEQRYCDQEQPLASRPGYVPHYSWYYYPRGFYWNGPALGSRVPTGGSYSAAPFASTAMTRSGSVVRHGLGSTASSHSSSGSHGSSGS